MTRPWPVVSLKDTMGTMGRDPQINEKDIFGPENFIARPPRRIMTFPETRVDLNQLIKKMKPVLGNPLSALPKRRGIQAGSELGVTPPMSGLPWKNPPAVAWCPHGTLKASPW